MFKLSVKNKQKNEFFKGFHELLSPKTEKIVVTKVPFLNGSQYMAL